MQSGIGCNPAASDRRTLGPRRTWGRASCQGAEYRAAGCTEGVTVPDHLRMSFFGSPLLVWCPSLFFSLPDYTERQSFKECPVAVQRRGTPHGGAGSSPPHCPGMTLPFQYSRANVRLPSEPVQPLVKCTHVRSCWALRKAAPSSRWRSQVRGNSVGPAISP